MKRSILSVTLPAAVTATVAATVATAMALALAMPLENAMAAGPVAGQTSANSDSGLQLSQSLFRQGQYPQALNAVNGWIVTHPKDAQARFLKGLILTEQNKPDEAIAVFTKLTEDFPELPEPYNNLAVLYAAQGKYEQARTALEMAIHTHPSYAVAHENLGDIYAKMASLAYDKALQLDTGNTTVHTKLSLIKEIFNPEVAQNECDGPTEKSVKPRHDTTSVPSPTPQSATAPADTHVSKRDSAIMTAVSDWAKAWSSQQPDDYLAAYAPDYATSHLSHTQWVAMRRNRLTTPKYIQIRISDLSVDYSDKQHASASFVEHYRSDHLDTSEHKILKFALMEDKWLIVAEHSH